MNQKIQKEYIQELGTKYLKNKKKKKNVRKIEYCGTAKG